MKALVTTMMSPLSVFVVRRLKSLGFSVTAIDSSKEAYGFYSNGVEKRVIVPSLRYDPLGYAEAVLEEMATEKYDIYIPILECSFLMAYYRDIVSKYTRMIAMPYDTITAIHNKDNVVDYTGRASIPTPETFSPPNLETAKTICSQINYPVIIKHKIGRNANGQRFVNDPQEIFPIYQGLVEKYKLHDDLPLIQRYIKSSLISSVNLARAGKILGRIVFKALRVVPATGGTSSYRVTYDCPAAMEYDDRLVEMFDWTGFISFDYMKEDETGNLYFIECNPRPAPGIILAYHAGVDLIGAYVDMLLEKPLEPLQPQRLDVRGKMQFLDLGWILFNLFDKEIPGKEKWALFKQWIKREKYHYDILNIKDMRPFLALYAFIAKRFFRLFGDESGEVFLEHVIFDENLFAEQLKGKV